MKSIDLDGLSEDELASLARVGTSEEQRAVARHPNTSLRTLLFLARMGFAEEVDQNPLLLLHIEGGSEDAVLILIRLAEQTNRPQRLVELACSPWKDVRLYVSWNDSTPSEAISILSKDESADVRRGVARNEKTPKSILSLFSKDPDLYVRRGTANNHSTPSEALTLLAMDGNEDVRNEAKATLAGRQKATQ
jgi:hypothetical protein